MGLSSGDLIHGFGPQATRAISLLAIGSAWTRSDVDGAAIVPEPTL
jgi:hypothetical protein